MAMLQVVQEHERQERRRRRRTSWVRPWLERRVHLGQYTRLMEELRLEDVRSFQNFLRVQPEMFEEIVERVTHRIWKQDIIPESCITWIEGGHYSEIPSLR